MTASDFELTCSVQPLQALHDLGRVKPRPVPAKPPPPGELRRQIPTRVEVHDEEQVILVMERVVQVDNERVLDVARHTP